MALRVVIVTPWGQRLGGAEEMLWLALSNLDMERIEPVVVFLSPGDFERDVAQRGLETALIPAGRLRRPDSAIAAVIRLSALLRSCRPDLLLNWSAKAHLYGSPAAVLAGMGGRVAWWQHQIPQGHWTERVATVLPTREVGCSSHAGQVGQASLTPERRTFVVNPGIEATRTAAPGEPDFKARLGIPKGRPVVGIVGRLQPWKGQDRFLLAVAELRRRGRDVHALVVGGTAYNRSSGFPAELDKLVADLGLADHVTMAGQVPDSDPYLRIMDVAVNASDGEPFGIVLLEAMAAGVPVVAVGKGGPLDIVEPGVTGLLTDSGEPLELADAIDDLLSDPDRRAAMGIAGRRRCRERFTAKLMADGLTAELARVADG